MTHLMLAGLKAGARPFLKSRQFSSVMPESKSGFPVLLIICSPCMWVSKLCTLRQLRSCIHCLPGMGSVTCSDIGCLCSPC